MPGPQESRAQTRQTVLADTHTLVWALASPDKLSNDARTALDTAEVLVSVASLWELIVKSGKPGALLTDPLAWWGKYVTSTSLRTLPIRLKHVNQLGRLMEHHRDPFDRILVAQAIVEGAILVSKDECFRLYDVPVIW